MILELSGVSEVQYKKIMIIDNIIRIIDVVRHKGIYTKE